MPTKRYSTDQVVSKLWQAEVELGRRLRVPQMCKKLGSSEQTYYRWRKEDGGLRLDQATRLKELERENTRLKKLEVLETLADLFLTHGVPAYLRSDHGPEFTAALQVQTLFIEPGSPLGERLCGIV